MIYVSIITIIYANIIMIYGKYDHHNEISPTIFTYKEVLTRSIPPKVTRRTLVIKRSVSSQEKSIRKKSVSIFNDGETSKKPFTKNMP